MEPLHIHSTQYLTQCSPSGETVLAGTSNVNVQALYIYDIYICIYIYNLRETLV